MRCSYSALHMNGKRLYEYAREGKPLPVEIKARPVTTVSLSMVDFTYEHEYEFPKEEAPKEEMVLVQQLADGAKELKAEDVLKAVEANKIQENAREGVAAKEEVKEESVAKEEIKGETAPVVESTTKEDTAPEEIVVDQNESAGEKRARSASPEDSTAAKKHKSTTAASGKPPIITLRMSVTSGFYVRSLIHDLGLALGSAAHMVKLVRTRQADYELGSEKVMEWEELMEKPEEVWGPKVEGFLRKWAEEREAGRG